MAIVPISKTITPITNIPDRATMALATFDQNATLFADQIKAMGLDLGTWAVQANTLAAAINIALNLGIGNSDFLRFVRAPGDIIHTAATSAPPGTLVCNGLPVSRTAYSDLFAALVTNAGFTPQSLQITITVPGTFTKVAHGFNGGERIRLSTTGALPTPLRTDVDYFVIPTGDATFHLSTSERTVSLVGLTGTQSGNHSYIQSIWGAWGRREHVQFAEPVRCFLSIHQPIPDSRHLSEGYCGSRRQQLPARIWHRVRGGVRHRHAERKHLC